MNSIVRTAGSLLIISAVAAAALGCVNSATEDKIAQRAVETKNKAMKTVLPSAASFEEQLGENDAPIALEQGGMITSYAKGGDGYAFSVETKGFDKGLNLMIGIDGEGKISGFTVVSSNETPGLGAKAKSEGWFDDKFTGKSGDIKVVKTETNAPDEVQAITGATITSKAVTNAVKDVQKFYNEKLKGGKG